MSKSISLFRACHDVFVFSFRASTAQDDITGDGTTSTVLLIGELLKQADNYISEGTDSFTLDVLSDQGLIVDASK